MKKLTCLITAFLVLSSAHAAAQSGRSRRAAPAAVPAAAGEDSSGESGWGKVYSSQEVSEEAAILSKPEPLYPREARASGVAGVVVLRVVLGSTGRVGDVEVLEGLPHGLTESAVRAARLIEFTPATLDGQAVAQYVTVEYGFWAEGPRRSAARAASGVPVVLRPRAPGIPVPLPGRRSCSKRRWP